MQTTGRMVSCEDRGKSNSHRVGDEATSDRQRGHIARLDDTDFTDDIGILSHSQRYIENRRTDKVGSTADTVVLKTRPTKTKLMELMKHSTRQTVV